MYKHPKTQNTNYMVISDRFTWIHDLDQWTGIKSNRPMAVQVMWPQCCDLAYLLILHLNVRLVNHYNCMDAICIFFSHSRILKPFLKCHILSLLHFSSKYKIFLYFKAYTAWEVNVLSTVTDISYDNYHIIVIQGN